ncbi:MAG: DUF4115 domain-containing protein [Candidatus Saelkia tenebricola]|nr:DUF4115 domain-containing protein [Candidatus Saelkia tenebricola]
MANIGVKLQKAREKLKCDYDYIYQKTKIHPKILKALEEENFEYFKSTIYIKSFLQKYAQFLGVDLSKEMEGLESVFLRVEKKESHKTAVTSPFLLSTMGKFFLGFKILFYFLLVIFSIYFVFAGVNKVVSLFLPDKISVSEQKEVSEEEIELPLQVQDEEKSDLLDKEAEQVLELMIDVQEDCWVLLRSDNKKIFESVLKKGQKEVWKAKKEFELWVGNASALKLFLNGASLGPIGRGVVKGIKIDSRGLRLP